MMGSTLGVFAYLLFVEKYRSVERLVVEYDDTPFACTLVLLPIYISKESIFVNENQGDLGREQS